MSDSGSGPEARPVDPAEPVLLPRPRRVDLAGPSVSVDGLPVGYAVDPSLPAEGYRIVLGTDELRIDHADDAGRVHAGRTLAQLGDRARAGLIEDWPDLAVRGVMLDISRDKVPTMDTLFALVDRLASWKLNHLELYIEHTFARPDHAEVWAGASPVTPDELRALDRYCAERHVELTANQNCLGHMERWLRFDRYRPLALSPDGFEFMGDHRGPSTLDPHNPAALELIRSLLADMLPCVASRRAHVGLDEPWELHDIDAYVDWVQAVRGVPELDGHQMVMWGDILANHPEAVDRLPPAVTVAEWGYDAGHPFGARAAWLAGHDRRFWTCPGTSSWLTLLGRWTNARTNIVEAADAAVAHGGEGLLITDWGDLGHLQYLPVSEPALAFAAGMAWCGAANRELDMPAVLDAVVFGDDAGVLGSTLLDLGDAHRLLGAQLPNMSTLTAGLYVPRLHLGRGPLAGLTLEQYEAARDVLARSRRLLGTARPTRADGGLVLDELVTTIDVVTLLCDDAVARLGPAGDGSLESIPQADRRRLAARIDPLVASHRQRWLARNRPGGLDDSCSRLRRLQSCYERGSTDGVALFG